MVELKKPLQDQISQRSKSTQSKHVSQKSKTIESKFQEELRQIQAKNQLKKAQEKEKKEITVENTEVEMGIIKKKYVLPRTSSFCFQASRAFSVAASLNK